MSGLDVSSEDAKPFRDMIVAAIMQYGDMSREDAEKHLDTHGVHIAPDPEEYARRFNVWYVGLSDEERDAYHHCDDGEDCDVLDCRLCAIRDTLDEPSVIPATAQLGEEKP